MAATSAKTGIGSLFKKGATAYVEVAEISPPEVVRNFAKATHLTSDDSVEEFVPGTVEVKSMSITTNALWKDTTQVDFLTDLMAGTKSSYNITFEEGTTDTVWTFSAYVESVKPEKVGTADTQRAVITFRPTTKITQT